MSSKKKSPDTHQKRKQILLLTERYFYFITHIGVVIYILYCVYLASIKYDGLLNVYDFDTGWSFIPREKDVSDYEWNFFYNLFLEIYHWYIAYIALDWLAVHHLSPVHRQYVGMLSSMAVLTIILGWKSLLLLCVHSIFMFTVSLLHSKALVWIFSVVLISTLNFEPFVSWMKLLNPDDIDGKSYYILVFTLAIVHLRYTSFCLEKCSAQEDILNFSKESDISKMPDIDILYTEKPKEDLGEKIQADCMRFSLIDAFIYIFYFPLFFTGPLITYNEFQIQLAESTGKCFKEGRLIFASFLTLRVIFWAFVNELVLHFLYFNALQHNLSVIDDMDLWTLSGIGYCQGQFFMIKYTVMFGLPTVVARVCGMDPPDGPKCIAHIYTYSDMWKYFDRGMYSFIKRYIYIPLGGAQGSLIQKLLCSLACFIFVYIWHGIEYYVFLWTLFNFIGILLEMLGLWIDQQPSICKFKASYPTTYRRLQGLAVVPLFVMSTFTAFCFFGGSIIGYKYYQKFIVHGWMKSWITVVLMVYCCVQSSMEINIWQRKRQQQSKTA